MRILLLALSLALSLNCYAQESKAVKGKKILYIERNQYIRDHHNTATLFQKGEINEKSFRGGSAMRIYDTKTKKTTTLYELPEGIVRDPELSYDAKKIIFSARKNKDDYYHIYEMNIDGTDIKQLTFAEGISDIDPLYLPDGGIVFSSTRQPKYCMCNRHIMANLFRMNADGSNITQIGVSTLFEGHSTMLPDGRILYDRWEYVDRNFGDAQGLWTVNPDGTKHAIYYGNNTKGPGAVIDARPIPGTDLVACIFGSCHDRPWGSLVVLDRKQGVDGEAAVVDIMQRDTRAFMSKPSMDVYKKCTVYYEDPFPISAKEILVSRTIFATKSKGNVVVNSKSGIYLVDLNTDTEELIIEGEKSLFDPIIVEPTKKPKVIPFNRNYKDNKGTFYVQNVYEGTHMEGVKPGSAKYIRLVETPEKRTYTPGDWKGEGAQAPGINWHSFETKVIWGEFPVEADGSAHFEAPVGKHLFFQLLDKDKKMIQSMRSGVSLMPGETYGCVGCHENRLSVPAPKGQMPIALKKQAHKINGWMGEKPKNFSYLETVQPIFNKHCVQCHDFDVSNREKLVLAGDLNPFFNASYVNIYVNKVVKLIGGGPAAIQQAYSWGSHPSKLTKIVDNKHKDVSLSKKEKEILYTWMDMNGVYYPVYETSFYNTLSGRCPLTKQELTQLKALTKIDFTKIATHRRKLQAQLSFERPELSPCLDVIREDSEKFNKAVLIIKLGQQRLKETPRGDIEKDMIMCEQHKKQINKYIERMNGEGSNTWHIDSEKRKFDK